MVTIMLSWAVKIVSDISDVEGLAFSIESLAFMTRTPLHYEVPAESDAFDTHYLSCYGGAL
jgi:hypothetical protein